MTLPVIGCPLCVPALEAAMRRIARKKAGPSGSATVEERWGCKAHGTLKLSASLREA